MKVTFRFHRLRDTHSHRNTDKHKVYTHQHIPVFLNQAHIMLLKYYVRKCFSNDPSFMVHVYHLYAYLYIYCTSFWGKKMVTL